MSEIETLSLLFDSAWYLATYQDVTAANCDPLEHYLAFGYKEGRNPNRFFDTNFYLTTYPDISACHLNPFIHYILYGASEGRLPRSPHQAPLPTITFDIFFQEEENTIVEAVEEKQTDIDSDKATSNEIKIKTKNLEEDHSVIPSKESIKITKEPTTKKRTIKTPAPKTKATTLAQQRKKTAKVSI